MSDNGTSLGPDFLPQRNKHSAVLSFCLARFCSLAVDALFTFLDCQMYEVANVSLACRIAVCNCLLVIL